MFKVEMRIKLREMRDTIEEMQKALTTLEREAGLPKFEPTDFGYNVRATAPGRITISHGDSWELSVGTATQYRDRVNAAISYAEDWGKADE